VRVAASWALANLTDVLVQAERERKLSGQPPQNVTLQRGIWIGTSEPYSKHTSSKFMCLHLHMCCSDVSGSMASCLKKKKQEGNGLPFFLGFLFFRPPDHNEHSSVWLDQELFMELVRMSSG